MAGMRIGVVGAGIIGFAVARRLAELRPDATVTVLEKEPELAPHQTGHNSGVVHAGIYYAPGSLKARLCREGVGLLRAYCDARGIPLGEAGKLIVAARRRRARPPRRPRGRASRNGVPGVRRLRAAAICRDRAGGGRRRRVALPHTAIVDFAQVARALAGDVRAGGRDGGDRARGHLRDARGPQALIATTTACWSRHALFCAAPSDRLAVGAGASPIRGSSRSGGEYFARRPERQSSSAG